MEYEYLQFSSMYNKQLHLGVTGSIAAFKSLEICRELFNFGIQISVSLTKSATQFVTPLSFEALGANQVFGDMFSPSNSAFAHLEPSETAEALLIAPATANTIAKLANGLADDMLSCQALAFNGPILLAPAMNPSLWSAKATQSNLEVLHQRGITIIEPQSGTVACGHTGRGRLPDIYQIIFQTLKAVTSKDLLDKNILITLGSTREYFDPIRFWSNPSSGKMGAALAVAAWLRGANVHCICGPNHIWLPEGIDCYPVTTANQMYEKALEIWPKSDIGCLCAAVSDYRPSERMQEKFKKDPHKDGFELKFTSNPDILKKLGELKTKNQKLIGFAAETEQDLFSAMQNKLNSKNLNLIVSNLINNSSTGFGSNSNEVQILDEYDNHQVPPVLNKADIAWKIWDWILKI